MNDREIELLLNTAHMLKESPLTEKEAELLKEYYTSGTGSIFNRMRMAMQMVLNIDTSMFELRKKDFDPVIEMLKELRELTEQLEEPDNREDDSPE